MMHIIFWLYIITIVITVVSIFSSYLVLKRIQEDWYPYFIKFLIGSGMILLSYTIFFFLFQYVYKFTNFLNELQLFFIYTATIYFIYTILNLGLKLFNYPFTLKQRLKIIILFWLFFIISINTFIFFFSIKMITFYTLFILLLLLILLIIGIIKRHKFKINKTNKILIYIFFISLLLLPFDFIEYFIRKKIFPSPTYIPQGIFIFAIYILIINYINLIFNINLLYKKELNYLNNFYEDAPEEFIKNYSLTIREKEIIEYLVKGYNHKDISKYLHISQRTVERHVYNIYKKCEINTKIDLVNLIREYQ